MAFGKLTNPCGSRLERAATPQRVRLVSDSTASNRLTMQSIALIVVYRGDRRVDGDLMKIGPAQTGQLSIDVRVNSSMQQGIVAEIDSGNDMRRAKRDLLCFREEVIGISVQHHATDGLHGNQFLGNQLGGIQDVEAEFLGVRPPRRSEYPIPIRDNYPDSIASHRSRR